MSRTSCRTIATHTHYRCLEHVNNIAIVTVIGGIMKIAAIETTRAIWKYDPTLPDNRVLGGSLDAIAAIWTLAVKVCIIMICILSVLIHVSNPQIQASGQHIEYFEQLQANSKILTPLKLKVHSNTWWGSAYDMADCALQLCQVRIPWSNYWTMKWQFAAHQSVHLSCWWDFRPYYCHSDKRKGH